MSVLIISLFFAASLSNFFIYRYAFDSQFDQLREKLMAVAQTAALAVDHDQLLMVPLTPDGVNSPAYKEIVYKLNEIKAANADIKFIYTMSRTEEDGIWQFIVDPDAVAKAARPNSLDAFPGAKYDARRFPEMLKAFDGVSVDNMIENDEWGATLSGYAPISDRQGNKSAILGIDMAAEDVLLTQRGLFNRGMLVLAIGVIFSLALGILISNSIAFPIKKLLEGTRHIAGGNLDYKVEIKSDDEFGELAASFNNMAVSLSESRKKLHDYFYRVVQAMIRSLEAKDHYTAGHSDRVSEFSQKTALQMGFSSEKASLLKEAAQLHDIGKLGIHEDVLNKKGPLSEEEWDMIHKHPAVGEEILKPVFLDKEMLSCVRSHHERYDGSGYPDGLKGDQINIFAQIVSVADAYDAMTSSRSYRPAMSKEDAIKRLRDVCGTQFNPQVVEALIKIL